MQNKKDPSDFGLAFLGRGILRTAKRDILAIGIGIAVGAGSAAIVGFSAKFGMLSGAFLGLFFRTLLSPLFEYDDPPSKGY